MGSPDLRWRNASRKSWPVYSGESMMEPGIVQLVPYNILAGERSSSSRGVFLSPSSTHGRLRVHSPPRAARASLSL